MISEDKYNSISSLLKKVTNKVWLVENNNRKENCETELSLYQEGFSIEECFTYKIGSTVFYFACNYSFLKIVERSILAARKKYPELFGTGDAQNIIEALYKESGHQNSIDEYCEYLRNYACCYVLYETGDTLSPNVLRIDLFRILKESKNNPLKMEFVGGFFHILDHFSINGQYLATEKDQNDVSEIDDILIYIAKAFLKCEGIKEQETKVTIQMENGKPLNCVFFWDEAKEVYYLTTIHRQKVK